MKIKKKKEKKGKKTDKKNCYGLLIYSVAME